MTRSIPLTPETLAYPVTVPKDPQLSPDGGTLAYTLERRLLAGRCRRVR